MWLHDDDVLLEAYRLVAGPSSHGRHGENQVLPLVLDVRDDRHQSGHRVVWGIWQGYSAHDGSIASSALTVIL